MTVWESGMNMLNVNPFAEQVVKGVVIAAALVLYGRTGQALRG
jgi:ribose/xylose/arabinose/galactoside ABC-type transport system permease subunit